LQPAQQIKNMKSDIKQRRALKKTAPVVFEGEEGVEEENSISKSEAKRRMTALQKVGEELVGLSVETLKKFDLPERLLEALLDAKRINPNKHGGMNRQMQFIGKLMRETDAEGVVAKLDELKAPSQKQNALNQLAEQWRTRMLADASAVGAFKNELMADDDDETAEALATLVAQAKEEYMKHQPPKYFRQLYKVLLKHITIAAAAPT
jgi:ribosome-associated protein